MHLASQRPPVSCWSTPSTTEGWWAPVLAVTAVWLGVLGELARAALGGPAGSAGDGGSFKRVFVTSTRYSGNLQAEGAGATGVEGADNICNQHGASLGGVWRACKGVPSCPPFRGPRRTPGSPSRPRGVPASRPCESTHTPPGSPGQIYVRLRPYALPLFPAQMEGPL